MRIHSRALKRTAVLVSISNVYRPGIEFTLMPSHGGTLICLSLCCSDTDVKKTKQKQYLTQLTDIKPLLDLLHVLKTSATRHHLPCRCKATTANRGKRVRRSFCTCGIVNVFLMVCSQTLCWMIGGVKRQHCTFRFIIFKQLQPANITCCYCHLSRIIKIPLHDIYLHWSHQGSISGPKEYFNITDKTNILCR